jgi:hypothetical protein
MNRTDRKLFNREMIAYMEMDKKWFEKYQALSSELEAVKRERNALIEDLRKARDCCHFCKHDAVYTSVCDGCKDGINFAWRGVQEPEAEQHGR